MPIVTQVQVRQPAPGDLIAEDFVVSGIGSGFEGTVGLRVLDSGGREIASGGAQSAGGMAGVGEFSTRLRIDSPPRAGATVTLQVFGDNPGLPDEGPAPGFDLVEVPLIIFRGMRGWIRYRVVAGDTLSSIRRQLRPFTEVTVAQIVAANPRIEDPDAIRVGWRLRVPQLD
jgi:phage tail protein X